MKGRIVSSVLLAFISLGLLSGCASVSTDDLTFRNGVFYDRTGKPYTGTALLTARGMLDTGIGMSPVTATPPYKLKVREGHVVVTKSSSFPLAPWSKLPEDQNRTTNENGRQGNRADATRHVTPNMP